MTEDQELALIGAYGDGWYDGFLAAQKEQHEMEGDSVIDYTDSEVLQMSEHAESNSKLSTRNKWVDVNEKMPNPKERVLLLDKDGFGVLSGRLINSVWYLEGDKSEGANITHWMPLPAPPTV